MPDGHRGQRVAEVVNQVGEQRHRARHDEHDRLHDRRHPEHGERGEHRAHALPRALDRIVDEPMGMAVHAVVIVPVVAVVLARVVATTLVPKLRLSSVRPWAAHPQASANSAPETGPAPRERARDTATRPPRVATVSGVDVTATGKGCGPAVRSLS